MPGIISPRLERALGLAVIQTLAARPLFRSEGDMTPMLISIGRRTSLIASVAGVLVGRP